MQYRFDEFTLDLSVGLLLRGEEEVPIEPRAYALLRYLIENNDRLVSKDELVEKIWDGRFISDAAIATLIKTTRRTVDDDGKVQRLIRTVHGRGFRFVGQLKQSIDSGSVIGTVEDEESLAPEDRKESGRPSIAVLPFRRIGHSETYSAIADAIPSELISSLSRLRWLRVVARGSTFRFRESEPDLTRIRTTLGATYCLTGDVEIFDTNLAIAVELSDTRDGRVIWAELMSGKIDDVHQIRADIIGLVTSGMELHVSLNEADRARLQSPESLDAWSVYHLGLRRMYRFNAIDNAVAADYFAQSINLDPGFARAYAARSFTSFQSAFVNYKDDRTAEIENAYRYAEKCLELDPMDPFGNFNYGRSHWLRNDHEAGQVFLERSISLSPSFSHGMYAYAFTDLMAGRGSHAIPKLDEAIILSPLDPFLYAMQTAKGFSLLHTGELEQACDWADAGSRQPGAHYLVTVIAAAINKIAERDSQARYWADRTHRQKPNASITQFFEAYPLMDKRVRKSVHAALRSLGFSDK